jgi:hypothetical protein
MSLKVNSEYTVSVIKFYKALLRLWRDKVDMRRMIYYVILTTKLREANPLGCAGLDEVLDDEDRSIETDINRWWYNNNAPTFSGRITSLDCNNIVVMASEYDTTLVV